MLPLQIPAARWKDFKEEKINVRSFGTKGVMFVSTYIWLHIIQYIPVMQISQDELYLLSLSL